MHIRSLAASVVLDCRARTAFAEAVVEYQLGHGGCPFFDLRQEIGKAWLDGHALDVARLASRDVGEGPNATVRVVAVEQAPGSVHTRARGSEPGRDRGPGARDAGSGGDGVRLGQAGAWVQLLRHQGQGHGPAAVPAASDDP